MHVVFFVFILCFHFIYTVCDKVIIVSGHSTIIPQEIYHNHHLYALHHNYNYSRFNTVDEQFKKKHAPHWMKVAFMLNILNEYTTAGELKFDWILWLDSDAIFVNMTRGIDDLILDFHIANNISFIFSADECIINSGVLLIKNTMWAKAMLQGVWDIGLQLDKYPKIGMGYDNAALIMFLVGCNATSTYEQLLGCYFKGALGTKDKNVKNQFFRANQDVFKPIIIPTIIPHIQILPHNSLNCYSTQAAEFIFHIPNRRRTVKDKVLKDLISHLNFSEPIM